MGIERNYKMDLGLDAFTVDPVKDFLAISASISSMMLNFSTLPNVVETVKNRATKRAESCFPNIVCAANCLLSFYYGKLMLDWTLLISGLIGCICYACYILVFVQYCPRESIATAQLMMGALWLSLFGTNHILAWFGPG